MIDNAPTSKTCITCRVVKPLDGFHYSASSSDDRQPRCRECHNRINREYRHTDKGRQAHNAATTQWRAANKARNLAARERTKSRD
jgi:hypothetical protein